MWLEPGVRSVECGVPARLFYMFCIALGRTGLGGWETGGRAAALSSHHRPPQPSPSPEYSNRFIGLVKLQAAILPPPISITLNPAQLPPNRNIHTFMNTANAAYLNLPAAGSSHHKMLHSTEILLHKFKISIELV